MENEVLLKAIEKLLDEKLNPIYQQLDSINSRLDSVETTQQTVLTFIKEVDKEFYKVEETYRFMNNLKKALNE